MRPAYKSCLFSILILVALSQPMVAQSSLASVVGVPPDSTVYPIAGLGFVNLGSGNLHLEIPLTEVRERNSATQTTSNCLRQSRLSNRSASQYPEPSRPILLGRISRSGSERLGHSPRCPNVTQPCGFRSIYDSPRFLR